MFFLIENLTRFITFADKRGIYLIDRSKVQLYLSLLDYPN